MPRVSVIIPALNAGRWIAEALDSIVAQTFRDFEIIVVDDGSTDDTLEIVTRYGDQVRVVRGQRTGLSVARNLGLAIARGEWIAFHDADDIAFPDRLDASIAFLASRPDLDTVFMNGLRMETGQPVIAPHQVPPGCTEQVGFTQLFEGFPLYWQGALVPRRVYATTGPFDPTFTVQPDIEYGWRMIRHCRGAFHDRAVFRYRWHDTNMSRDFVGQRAELAQIFEQLLQSDPAAVREIGRDRLEGTLAHHHYRLGRRWLTTGEDTRSLAALDRAIALRPFNPRYRYYRWRAGWS